jgi:hypothetical protein
MLLHCIIIQPFVTIGHLEFKLILTFTMNFSLLKPNFAKYFASETKYSIVITANDSLSLKSSQFLRMKPLKSLFSGALSLMSLHSSGILMLPTSLQVFYFSSVEMPRTSGLMPTMMLCPTMKILPKLASVQCGLPSLSTMEHLTKLPKEYETFYKRSTNQPI